MQLSKILTQKPEEKLFSCYLIVEDIDPLIVVDAQASTSSHYSPTQVGISLCIGQKEHLEGKEKGSI